MLKHSSESCVNQLDKVLKNKKFSRDILNSSKQDCLSHRRQATHKHKKQVFCSCDLDLDPTTLIYEPNLDIPKLYLQTKNKLSRWILSKVRALQTDRQTDRQTDTQRDATEDITTLHSRTVITVSMQCMLCYFHLPLNRPQSCLLVDIYAVYYTMYLSGGCPTIQPI